MDLFAIISLTTRILDTLLPIASDVYRAVQDPTDKTATKKNAVELIRQKAAEKGLDVGHTEAEIARSAIHFMKAKAKRHQQYIP